MTPKLGLIPLVALNDMHVHLGERHVLRGITWTLERGTHWGFVGPNGSGKSTLLRVIAGTQWIDYDGGTRTYSSDGVNHDAVGRAKTWIRFVSAEQHERYARLDLALPGRSIVESGFHDSVYVGRQLESAASERVNALIDELALGPFADRPLREMSSGQFGRLLIARALVREPLMLVLDEFTNGLDRTARRDVTASLDRIARSVTLVIASHRSTDFPAAITHSATMSDGRLQSIQSGRPVLRQAAVPALLPTRRAQPAELLIDIRAADVYRGKTLVLRNIDWQLRRGEHTAIRGANGSGKSTFAGLVAGTISAATGARIVRFGATEPFDIWDLKKRIAHVSDDLQIAYDQHETVEAVIASGFSSSIGLFSEANAQQLATVDELIERIEIEALRGRSFAALSFGERAQGAYRSQPRPPARYLHPRRSVERARSRLSRYLARFACRNERKRNDAAYHRARFRRRCFDAHPACLPHRRRHIAHRGAR